MVKARRLEVVADLFPDYSSGELKRVTVASVNSSPFGGHLTINHRQGKSVFGVEALSVGGGYLYLNGKDGKHFLSAHGFVHKIIVAAGGDGGNVALRPEASPGGEGGGDLGAGGAGGAGEAGEAGGFGGGGGGAGGIDDARGTKGGNGGCK